MRQVALVAGSVIVSTAQEIALIEARKAAEMFRKVEVPVLGLLENMASFVCPKCAQQTRLFASDLKLKAMAEKLNIDLLGMIWLLVYFLICLKTCSIFNKFDSSWYDSETVFFRKHPHGTTAGH